MSEFHPQSPYHEISVSRLTLVDGEVIDSETNELFDAQGYSWYKYGCGEAASNIAQSIADKLLVERASLLAQGQEDILDSYFITSSAYKHVPTAAYYVTRRVVGELAAAGVTPSGLVRIDRAVTKSADYSAMTEAERQIYIADNNVHVPPISSGDIRQKTVVVVDDIKNTGSNERSFISALEAHKVGRMIFCYAAVIDPSVSSTYPRIEADLNQAYVKDLSRFTTIAKRPDFEVNARICRYVMDEIHDPESITTLVNSIPYGNARAILAGIVCDGYHTLTEYATNFQAFQNALQHRRLATHNNPQSNMSFTPTTAGNRYGIPTFN